MSATVRVVVKDNTGKSVTLREETVHAGKSVGGSLFHKLAVIESVYVSSIKTGVVYLYLVKDTNGQEDITKTIDIKSRSSKTK